MHNQGDWKVSLLAIRLLMIFFSSPSRRTVTVAIFEVPSLSHTTVESIVAKIVPCQKYIFYIILYFPFVILNVATVN